MTEDDNIVDLGKEPPAEDPPRRPGRLHGAAITVMALSALAGIVAMVAFITIDWGGASRYLVVALVMAGVCFLAAASVAVFSAARDTYADASARRREPDRR